VALFVADREEHYAPQPATQDFLKVDFYAGCQVKL
jgi:hypothetical protein